MICKKVLKAKDFVPILSKCHENVEHFSQFKRKLRLHDMLLWAFVAWPIFCRDIFDEGMALPHESLALVGFF